MQCRYCATKSKRHTPTCPNNVNTPCKHCKKKNRLRRFGLCNRCYDQPEIAKRYGFKALEPLIEPTQEEIDKLIEEQSESLPDWWERETDSDYEKNEARRDDLPAAVIRGRRMRAVNWCRAALVARMAK